MSVESFAANCWNVAVSALLTPSKNSEIELRTEDDFVVRPGPARFESPVGRETVEPASTGLPPDLMHMMRFPADEEAQPRPKPKRKVSVPSHFKLVFLVVVGITVAAGLAQILMAAYWTMPTPNEQSVFEGMGFAWKSGIGAVFGLLGGKVLN